MIGLAVPLAQYRSHAKEVDAAIKRVLESGRYILGDEVEDFERAFAAYCGVAHAAGVNSGTDALMLALRAFGVGAGDEVITASHTALATGAAILAAGAVPVLVDIDPVHFTIDTARIEAAITANTKALIVVHLYGQTVDLDAVMSIAKDRGLKVIEDCAQATGAVYKGRRVGSVGDAGCFSFYPTKNLGGIGDGGAVVSNDAGFIERLRRLRQYGWDDTRQTSEVGFNSRLDPLQAAILSAKLPALDGDNERRAAIASRYNKGLSGLALTLPCARDSATHVYHLYVIACDDRDSLAEYLASRHVGAAVHYPAPVHRHGGYAERVKLPKGGLPETERCVGRILSLPMYPELSDADVDQVIAAMRDYFKAD